MSGRGKDQGRAGMRLIIEDGLAVRQGTGIGRYTLSLLGYLRQSREIEEARFLPKNPWGALRPPILRRGIYLAWLHTTLLTAARRAAADVIHFTNYLIPGLRLRRTRYVVTVHDLAAWRAPETLPARYRTYIKRATAHAVKRADLVLTVSETVRTDLGQLFPREAWKVRTAYNGIDASFFTTSRGPEDPHAVAVGQRYGLRPGFVLCVGVIEERKNIITLLRALERLREPGGIQLVLVGRPGFGYERIQRYIRSKELGGDVILAGYVSEGDLRCLYDLAGLLVFPSLYEGFGLPLVEAMARGVPVVASRIPSTVEVAGDAVAYYDGVLEPDELAARMGEVIEDRALRESLIGRGRDRCRSFAWEAVGSAYLRAYRDLVQGPGGSDTAYR